MTYPLTILKANNLTHFNPNSDNPMKQKYICRWHYRNDNWYSVQGDYYSLFITAFCRALWEMAKRRTYKVEILLNPLLNSEENDNSDAC